MSNDRMNMIASLLSPLFVAAVIVSGLTSLSVQNLNHSNVMYQASADHTGAIQRLFFRN